MGDVLLDKYNDYLRIIGSRAVYVLENGLQIEFIYRRDNFVHLLGLHKLDDIMIIAMFNDKNILNVNTRTVISNIKKGKLTDQMVQNSVYFHKIKSRYESFNYDNLTTLNYTDAVVGFDASKIHSRLKSDYLLFEEKQSGKYNHIGIAVDHNNGIRYPETFFYTNSDFYIKGQSIVKVKGFKLEDKNGNIIVEDYFQ